MCSHAPPYDCPWFQTVVLCRSRSRERRSRRSRSRDRKAKSLSPIKDERTKEQKELDELTKDQRTVFVSQLVSCSLQQLAEGEA